MLDGARNGARDVAVANLAPNSPNAACCAFERTRQNVATSQNAVEPPFPSATSYPSGSENSSARPARIRRTSARTGS